MRLKNVIYALIIVVTWASTSVIGRFLVGINNEVKPLQLSFYRYFTAGLGLYLIGIATGKASLQELRAYSEKWRLGVTVFVSALFPVFMFYGVQSTTAIASSILLNGNTIFIAIMSYFVLHEAIHRRTIVGVGIAIIGVLFIVLDNGGRIMFSGLVQGSFLGNILSLLAGVSWAVFTILLKMWFSDIDAMEVMTFMIFGASLLIFPIMLVIEGWVLPLSWQFLILLFILGIGATTISYYLYNVILQEEHTVVTGSIQLAVPVVAVFMGILFLHEHLDVILVFGTVLVLFGLYLVNSATNSATAENEVKTGVQTVEEE